MTQTCGGGGSILIEVKLVVKCFQSRRGGGDESAKLRTRRLQVAGGMQGESVNVSVRIRPLLSHEDGEKEVFERHVLADGREVIRAKEAESGILFNKVYTKQQTNEDVFGGIGKRMVSRLLEGFNGTVFMYGQTGSGKTHTMTGSENDAGLTPRIIDHLFEEIRSSTERQFLVRGSYLEIYNEQVFDLCCDRAKRELKFNTKTDAFFVDGLKEQIAKQAADLQFVLKVKPQRKWV